MLILPNRNVNKCEDIHDEVSSVAFPKDIKNFSDNLLLSKDHLVKGRQQERLLQEDIISMVDAVQEEIFI